MTSKSGFSHILSGQSSTFCHLFAANTADSGSKITNDISSEIFMAEEVHQDEVSYYVS